MLVPSIQTSGVNPDVALELSSQTSAMSPLSEYSKIQTEMVISAKTPLLPPPDPEMQQLIYDKHIMSIKRLKNKNQREFDKSLKMLEQSKSRLQTKINSN